MNFFNQKTNRMSKYMMLIRNEGDAMANLSDEERESHMQRWGQYMGGMGDKLLDGLPFASEGSVVSSSGATGSRYGNGKTNVGGYLIVETDSLDQAVDLSKSCPALENETSSIEVRECMNM